MLFHGSRRTIENGCRAAQSPTHNSCPNVVDHIWDLAFSVGLRSSPNRYPLYARQHEGPGDRCREPRDAATAIPGGRSKHEQRAVARENSPSGGRAPFDLAEVEATSCATSPSAGRIYGVARVLREWELARSSFYQQRSLAGQRSRIFQRRGPKTAWTDAALTEKIREALVASPFFGEGHRKVWARLRFQGGHLEGTRAPTDARSSAAGSLSDGPGGREPAHGHDHPRAAECSLGDRQHGDGHRPGGTGDGVRRGRSLHPSVLVFTRPSTARPSRPVETIYDGLLSARTVG
jgi:hypothetical protein